MSADLARLVDLVADDLEQRGYQAHGVVRRAARALTSVPELDQGACPVCGGEVVQPATGRRRKFCSDRCRRRNATKAHAGSHGSE